jgi:hypothetical protein
MALLNDLGMSYTKQYQGIWLFHGHLCKPENSLPKRSYHVSAIYASIGLSDDGHSGLDVHAATCGLVHSSFLWFEDRIDRCSRIADSGIDYLLRYLQLENISFIRI